MDQRVDLAQHGIKFPGQGADLVRRRVSGQHGAGGSKIALLLIDGLHRFAQGVDGLCDKPCHVEQHPRKQHQNGTLAEDQGVAGRVDLAINFMIVEHTAQPQAGEGACQPADEIFLAAEGGDLVALRAVRKRQCCRRFFAAVVNEAGTVVEVQFGRLAGQAVNLAVQQIAHVQSYHNGARLFQAHILTAQDAPPAEDIGIIRAVGSHHGKTAGRCVQSHSQRRQPRRAGVRHILPDGQGVAVEVGILQAADLPVLVNFSGSSGRTPVSSQ